MIAALHIDGLHIDRDRVRFPIELRPPAGFEPDDPATWPEVDGRLEHVDGRLLYLPPCGDTLGDVVASGFVALAPWLAAHPEFVVSSDEAGMRLAGGTRGADIGIWRRLEAGPQTGGFRRVPPILAVEVEGQDEEEAVLLEKARWYFDHGVRVVWIVLPGKREVLALTPLAQVRCKGHDALPTHPDLPDLSPPASAFFTQLR